MTNKTAALIALGIIGFFVTTCWIAALDHDTDIARLENTCPLTCDTDTDCMQKFGGDGGPG